MTGMHEGRPRERWVIEVHKDMKAARRPGVRDGIDHDTGAVVEPAIAVLAIAGQARVVGNQCVTRTRHAVEQGRFPYVRATNKCNDG